jgi:hypothetical protein
VFPRYRNDESADIFTLVMQHRYDPSEVTTYSKAFYAKMYDDGLQFALAIRDSRLLSEKDN